MYHDLTTVSSPSNHHHPTGLGASVTFHLLTWHERVDTFSLKAGGNINYHSLRKGTELHTHEAPEVLLVLSGKIMHVVNGETRELTTGALVFIRPSDSHRFAGLESEPCELVNFAFSLELLHDLSRYVENDFFLKRFTAPATPPVFQLSASDTERLGMELLTINTYQVSALASARIKVKFMLTELFVNFFLEPKNALAAHDMPEWFEELLGEMRLPKNFIRGLKRMQSLACCTPEHLCKTFKRYLNKTPTEFINELRVNHAARALLDTNAEIYAIASDLNFKSLSRFYHLFKAHYGVSPAKYRRIGRKNDIPV